MKETIISTVIIFSLLILVGCQTLDLTKGHKGTPPRCKIHNKVMQAEKIQVSGESIYVLPYIQIARKNFPNHGGHRLNGEKKDKSYRQDVVDWVCPECDYKYFLYWKDLRKHNVRN